MSIAATELCELGTKYGTDKVIAGYTRVYDKLLSPRRGDITSVIEVGVGTPGTMTHVPEYRAGASLRMWQSYFPAATVYGIDIDDSVFDFVNTPRIRTIKADQHSFESLWVVARMFKQGTVDLIVDDGDHTADAQMNTLRAFYSLVKPDGMYVIEDAQDHEKLSRHLFDIGVDHSFVQCMNSSGYPSGKMIII